MVKTKAYWATIPEGCDERPSVPSTCLLETHESQQMGMREDDPQMSWSGCPREALPVRLGRAFRADPHEGCSCYCCCSNSSALQERVGQSVKLEAHNAGCADTKRCPDPLPSMLFSVTCSSCRERRPPLLRVSGGWKMLLMGPHVLSGLAATRRPPGLVPAELHTDPLLCPERQSQTPVLSVAAGQAAEGPANVGGCAEGQHPAPDWVSLSGTLRGVSTLSGLCLCTSVKVSGGVSPKRKLIELKWRVSGLPCAGKGL